MRIHASWSMQRTGAELDPPVAEPSPRNFEAFYGDEHGGLFGALYLIAGNRQEAEELMQDAFLKLWERWDRVGSLEDPTGYLYRTALNLFRMRRRRAAVAVRQAVGRMPSHDAFDAVERKDIVDQALASLAPRQRAAVVLMDLLGFSSEEASRMLGVKPVTIRVLASQARAVLRRTMEPPDE